VRTRGAQIPRAAQPCFSEQEKYAQPAVIVVICPLIHIENMQNHAELPALRTPPAADAPAPAWRPRCCHTRAADYMRREA